MEHDIENCTWCQELFCVNCSDADGYDEFCSEECEAAFNNEHGE